MTGMNATETAVSRRRKKLNPMVKLALELGPLLLFFIAYARLGIFAATAVLMAGVVVTLDCSNTVVVMPGEAADLQAPRRLSRAATAR